MDDSYRDIEFELYGNLVQIKSILASYDTRDEILMEIDKTISQIKSKTYNVAVIGEFRRGKSSLINALLGLDVLPSDVTPTTATINRITFGTEPRVVVHYKDGARQEVSISELGAYVTKITEENEKTALTIREAVIYYPTVICQNHVDIIDTPGLNDDEAMTRTTIELLSHVDAVIVAVSALSPYSETEKNFVAQLLGTSGIRHIIFVVTFIDQIDEDEFPKLFNAIKARICTMTRKELAARFPGQPDILKKGEKMLNEDKMKIFGISAKQALKSFAANDRKLLKKSRFVEFKEDLYKILTAQQSVNIVEKTSALINSAAKRFDNIYKDKFDVINADIVRLKSGLEQIACYYDSKAALMDTYRQEHQSRLSALTGDGATKHGEIIRLFIDELTKVKVNTTAEIRKAVETGRARAEQHVRAIQAQDYAVVTDMFLSLGRLMAQRREALLLRHVLAETKIKPHATEQFLQSFEGQIGDLHKPAFIFTGSFIPMCDNLAHFNVIAHIHKTASSSVNAYLTDLIRFIEACWSACQTLASYDDSQQRDLLGELSGALRHAETAMLVCQSNYQLHKNMVESLVGRTNELLTRFEERGVTE